MHETCIGGHTDNFFWNYSPDGWVRLCPKCVAERREERIKWLQQLATQLEEND